MDAAPIGAWAEGVVFLHDSRTVLAESIVDRAIQAFHIDDAALETAGPPLTFDNGAPVGIGVAGR